MLASRRRFLIGSTSMLSAVRSEPALAVVPAILAAITGITALWNGYKVAEEIYERIFESEKKRLVLVERERIIERLYVLAPQCYRYDNPYRFRGLSEKEPGFLEFDSRNPFTCGMICGCENGALGFQTGFLIALSAALEALRYHHSEEAVSAYTRALGSRRDRPWSQSGRGQTAQLFYASPRAEVGLQWHIPDRKGSQSLGQFVIRDAQSGVIVAEGETRPFKYS